MFFIYTVFSRADYLNIKTTNQCVYNVTPYQGNKGLCYVRRSDDKSFCNKNLRYSHLIAGYHLVGSDCVLKNDLQLTGLTQEDFDYLMAVLAHIMGFTMLFMMSFISYNVAKA